MLRNDIHFWHAKNLRIFEHIYWWRIGWNSDALRNV